MQRATHENTTLFDPTFARTRIIGDPPLFRLIAIRTMVPMLRCSFCGHDLTYVHGHAACICSECPLRGMSQADCCAGEDAACSVHVVPRTPMADPRTSGIWRVEGDDTEARRIA